MLLTFDKQALQIYVVIKVINRMRTETENETILHSDAYLTGTISTNPQLHT